MPPRITHTTSFPASDENNVVVCPLRNHDGSACRKRCTGEKKFRSMQEHIRRAHPEHYIAKLPATEESFTLMVNTPPSERPPPPPPPNTSAGPQAYANDHSAFYTDDYNAEVSRTSDEMRRGSLLPAASAAAALAQLHNHRAELGWESDPDPVSEPDSKNYRPRARFAPATEEQHMTGSEPYYTSGPLQRELLPSTLARSPPGRSSTLPPAPRSIKPNRPRKSSVGENARKPKHERVKSKGHSRRMSHDRKAFSAEPQTAAQILGKRWEDLLDAATSATEADSRDLTPIPGSPRRSPHPSNRASLPPYIAAQFHHHYPAQSPLHNTLTPPPPDHADLQPFPSVESSIESVQSGLHFHIPSQGLSDSSPTYPHPVQIYCAGCRKLSALRESYACCECISGLCQDCVDVLVSEQTRGRMSRCPRCGAIGGKFKPFQLDIR